ncbi:FAD-binding oxidoreductase [uncultured Acetatifactor sp.]|jgi:alkyldihydroxyacetonephosphate synthase|uniref:FAD-binding oxidoreductase n=2 Tax=uncultured Acetatifactor sp. TaxID=1671927 RepID=UPI0026280E45|nr:FAD-binding oxidoreductase [uncultured Acetatifactor sp.]
MKGKSFMSDMIRFELEDVVGRENVSTTEAERATYSVDYFWISRMWEDHGAEGPMADVIVRPGSSEEVSRILKIANYYKLPVHTWGGGSGSQGGALPMAGGILLDMKRMNHLISIDENAHSITAEAGMIFQQLEWYANERGYSCMHIPSCLTCGTIGGALGHRGVGILSSRYGKIDDMCMSMEVVLPNGDIMNTLPVPKHAAGPDLNQIFIGSEGTLGVITKATFRLFEQPECRRHRGFMFPDLTAGLEAGRDIMQKCQPSIMRLFDEAETVSIIKKIIGVEERGSFMNLTLEGIAKIVDIEMEMVIDICVRHGGRDMGSEYGEKWYENRITFFYPDHIMDIPQMFGTMDTVADFSHVEKIYWAMKNAIESNFPGVRFIAHCSHWYGWGTMIYDRFIMDDSPEDREEALRLHNQIWNTGVRAAMENGGVINDHHGIGLKLARLMKEQYGPAFQVMEGLKKALDPNGIMNPYKLGL